MTINDLIALVKAYIKGDEASKPQLADVFRDVGDEDMADYISTVRTPGKLHEMGLLLQEILWPDGNRNKEWYSTTIAEVAYTLEKRGYYPDFPNIGDNVIVKTKDLDEFAATVVSLDDYITVVDRNGVVTEVDYHEVSLP